MVGAAPLRVATWNLWWRHGEGAARMPAMAHVISSLGVDVIALQEVSTEAPDHVRWLRDELGFHVVASPDIDADRHRIANAIASRWPIRDSRWQYLDVGDMPPHRTVLRATLDAPVGEVRVYCTHLSHGFDQSDLRRRQLSQITEMVAAERGPVDASYPPLVLGDLNAVPDSDEIRMLTGRSAPAVEGIVFSDVWEHVGEGAGATFCETNPYVVDSAWPARRLDYVLVGWPRRRPCGNPVSAWRFGLEAVDDVFPSDHYGVIAELHA